MSKFHWFISIFFLDRVSKSLVLSRGFNYSLNRGISFSLFHYNSDFNFYIVTAVIALVLSGFTLYTWYEYKLGKSIFGEVCVLSGGLSNLVDRFIYCGVIDFIDIGFGDWHWPTFNIADVFIVFGIGVITLKIVRDDFFRKN